MHGRTPKNENNNLLAESYNQEYALTKFNSSKIKRNSMISMLNKFQSEYPAKYFELNNKNKKCDTPKNSRKNKKVTNIKSLKKNKRASVIYNNKFNNLNNYLENLYQNDKHMKKNILKKKKDDTNKKHNAKVSFKMNMTPKNDSFKFNKKKLNFSNYLNNDANSCKYSESKNPIEEEDGQAYGFNKPYKIKMFEELNKDSNSLNKEEYTPKIMQVSLFKKSKEKDGFSEKEKTNKTFISPKFNDSEKDKLRESHLKLKLKKTRSNPNFKKLKKILTKTIEQEKINNNNLVNINYNINVNNPINYKFKQNTIKKKETNKSNKKYKGTDNMNRTELIKINKNIESSITNKTSNNKNDNNNNDIDNSPKKTKKNDKIYTYIQNCCFPFFACLKGNNH